MDPVLLGLEFGPRALRNIQHQDLVGDEKDHHGKPGAPGKFWAVWEISGPHDASAAAPPFVFW